ncbi:peptide chain release factor N(5)-glutamine methyltransferase [Pelistega europaea]|uniref:Release factor glutamine methyltransferase n=1 Tax=Pelistega europaea TaxID=106147 RepID=A0A7Y4P6P9_9BURK|nr:peptide chain release factor N(5)-glutamine methyltransferase [Pelistega europaea]NOL49965.1 peptide chain release factor N(5)-glutamine methyltransferase [Pelistega europaea]
MVEQYTLRQFFAQSGLPLLEAKMIAEKVLQVNRAWLITHDTDMLSAEDWVALSQLAQRRLSGEPMAYIMGEREFMGLMFTVSPAVLIPRPDTEILVEEALSFMQQQSSHTTDNAFPKYQQQSPLKVLDLGTGSGAIAVSIAHYAPYAEVWAGELSVDALEVAQTNATALNTTVKFRHGSWFEPFTDMTFDLIVSNPPYIAKEDIHLQQGDLRFEPAMALTDFDDGLTAYQTIISNASHYLNPQGALMLEHGWNQADAVRNLLLQKGFAQVRSIRDLAGIERVSIGICQ